MKPYTHPLNGQISGSWTVIDNSKIKVKSTHAYFSIKCQCKCGYIKYVRVSYFFTGKTKMCKKCSLNKTAKDKSIFNAPGNISLTKFNSWKVSALKRNLKWEITPIYIWDLFNKQNGLCALSNESLKLSFFSKDMSKDNTSLDRINSSLGYTEDNVQLVTKFINIGKNSQTQKDFIKMCHMVAKKHPI